jgi:uncharacterized membrane protein
VADGWFDLVMWLGTAGGIALLWSGVRGAGRLPSLRAVCGYLLVGWGAFNMVEGIVNHHLLELHHVRDLPTHMVFYDWAFLVISGALILFGLALRDGKSRVPVTLDERRSGRERRMAYR